MRPLRLAIFGAGFWTRFQLSAWREFSGIECVGIYNRTRTRAEAIAAEFGIPAVYDDPEALLRELRPDVVDNITEIGGHHALSLACARHRTACICQKPMAANLADARDMVRAFEETATPFFVHENWRWQAPMRALIRVVRSGELGAPFRARLSMVSGFAPWDNQPALAQLEQFILTDLGTHLVDTARACFGEARSVYCQLHRTLRPEVRGDNVATIVLAMGEAATSVVIDLAYAKTPLERECFPQTIAFVEGTLGSVEVTPGYDVRVTTASGTRVIDATPTRYPWADPRYDVVHASIVECLRDLLPALRAGHVAETTGADNLKTLEVVFAAYESAARDEVVRLRP